MNRALIESTLRKLGIGFVSLILPGFVYAQAHKLGWLTAGDSVITPIDLVGGIGLLFGSLFLGTSLVMSGFQKGVKVTHYPESESVVSDPEILGGTPVFRGTRVPVDSLIDHLEAGDSLDVFLDDFPSVTREMAIAALEEAKAFLTSRGR